MIMTLSSAVKRQSYSALGILMTAGPGGLQLPFTEWTRSHRRRQWKEPGSSGQRKRQTIILKVCRVVINFSRGMLFEMSKIHLARYFGEIGVLKMGSAALVDEDRDRLRWSHLRTHPSLSLYKAPLSTQPPLPSQQNESSQTNCPQY